jgi:4-hydroxy-3-methylbut-2-enyl diphosphate reductase
VRAPRKDDICYATQNRQDAVKRLARECQVVLVVGSRNSSNSNRLREVAEVQGAKAWMIDGPDDIRREWLEGANTVGLTAGASAPEVLVQAVVSKLREWGAVSVSEQPGQPETVSFPPPKSLRAAE